MDVTVRRLVPDDTEAYVSLRQAMLIESPLAFLSSPDADFASDPATVRDTLADGQEKVIIGAFTTALVGSIGMFRERHAKASHKAHIWGMFVAPELRSRGIGKRLLQAAVSHARTMPGVSQVGLSVSEAAPEARRLYESAGFRVWGTEPHAIFHLGRTLSEDHMVLFLDAGEGTTET